MRVRSAWLLKASRQRCTYNCAWTLHCCPCASAFWGPVRAIEGDYGDVHSGYERVSASLAYFQCSRLAKGDSAAPVLLLHVLKALEVAAQDAGAPLDADALLGLLQALAGVAEELVLRVQRLLRAACAAAASGTATPSRAACRGCPLLAWDGCRQLQRHSMHSAAAASAAAGELTGSDCMSWRLAARMHLWRQAAELLKGAMAPLDLLDCCT